MNELLTKLGVPSELQAFFGWCETIFDLGDDKEVFQPGSHYVPTTHHLWVSGSPAASTILLGHSAMELVAYLSLHSSFYPDLNAVSLIALGNVPLPKQIRYLCARYKNRRFELIFGNDLLAPLIDIKIALALKQQWVTFTLVKDQVAISCNQGTRQFSLDRLSLSAFQKAFGLRTSVRTRKSKRHTYFLNELLESHSIDGLSGDR